MSRNAYTQSVLRIAVAQICQNIGWHSIQSSCLEVLVDVLHRYLRELSLNTRKYSEEYGRTDPNFDDLGLAFKDLSISLAELEEYISFVEPVAFAKGDSLPAYPVRLESITNQFINHGPAEDGLSDEESSNDEDAEVNGSSNEKKDLLDEEAREVPITQISEIKTTDDLDNVMNETCAELTDISTPPKSVIRQGIMADSFIPDLDTPPDSPYSDGDPLQIDSLTDRTHLENITLSSADLKKLKRKNKTKAARAKFGREFMDKFKKPKKDLLEKKIKKIKEQSLKKRDRDKKGYDIKSGRKKKREGESPSKKKQGRARVDSLGSGGPRSPKKGAKSGSTKKVTKLSKAGGRLDKLITKAISKDGQKMNDETNEWLCVKDVAVKDSSSYHEHRIKPAKARQEKTRKKKTAPGDTDDVYKFMEDEAALKKKRLMQEKKLIVKLPNRKQPAADDEIERSAIKMSRKKKFDSDIESTPRYSGRSGDECSGGDSPRKRGRPPKQLPLDEAVKDDFQSVPLSPKLPFGEFSDNLDAFSKMAQIPPSLLPFPMVSSLPAGFMNMNPFQFPDFPYPDKHAPFFMRPLKEAGVPRYADVPLPFARTEELHSDEKNTDVESIPSTGSKRRDSELRSASYALDSPEHFASVSSPVVVLHKLKSPKKERSSSKSTPIKTKEKEKAKHKKDKKRSKESHRKERTSSKDQHSSSKSKHGDGDSHGERKSSKDKSHRQHSPSQNQNNSAGEERKKSKDKSRSEGNRSDKRDKKREREREREKDKERDRDRDRDDDHKRSSDDYRSDQHHKKRKKDKKERDRGRDREDSEERDVASTPVVSKLTLKIGGREEPPPRQHMSRIVIKQKKVLKPTSSPFSSDPSRSPTPERKSTPPPSTSGSKKKSGSSAAAPVKPPSTGISSKSVITETVGMIIDEHGNQIWICPACTRPDDGSPMIGCDECDDWYHWVCVGIVEEPPENQNWFCCRCIAKRQTQQNKKKKKKHKKDK